MPYRMNRGFGAVSQAMLSAIQTAAASSNPCQSLRNSLNTVRAIGIGPGTLDVTPGWGFGCPADTYQQQITPGPGLCYEDSETAYMYAIQLCSGDTPATPAQWQAFISGLQTAPVTPAASLTSLSYAPYAGMVTSEPTVNLTTGVLTPGNVVPGTPVISSAVPPGINATVSSAVPPSSSPAASSDIMLGSFDLSTIPWYLWAGAAAVGLWAVTKK